MAQRIKGITIEINGDTTGLQKSLEKVDSAISNTRSELRDINKLLKLDPGNAELLAQKQKNLAQAITDTKSRLEQLKNAQAGVKEGTSDWDKLQREIISTEKDLEKLEKDYKNFGSIAKQQIQAVADKMAALGTKMQEVGSKLKSVGTTLSAAVTLPLVAAGTAAVKNFAEVDKTLQLVNSTMGNTAQQSKLITDAMKDAAANSVYGMSEAAEATLNFARAGLTAEQAAATLAPAMNLAAGEGGALETVSAGLVATINGFAGSFDEAAKYADVFANACNNSALDINSLSQAMSIAAPIFRSAGYSVKDAALYMGVMANAGIDANTAANSLKTGLARLVSPAKDAQGWIEKLGINVKNADGSMKDSVTIQKQLHQAFSTLSESEQIAAASAIFGKNQMSNWLALINTAPESVLSLADALDVEGTTAKMAGDMMSGFGGSMEKLKSSIDVAAYSLGEALAPTISKVADIIQKLVDWFNSLSDRQREIIAKIGVLVALLGPVIIIIGTIISSVGTILKLIGPLATGISSLIPVFSSLGAVVTGTVIPAITSISPVILVVIAAVAALVVGIVALVKNWDTVSKAISNGAKALGNSLKSAWNNIKTGVDNLGKSIEQRWNSIRETVKNNIESLKTGAINGFNEMKMNIASAMENVRSGVQSRWDAIKGYMSGAVNNIKTSALGAFSSMAAGIGSAMANLKGTIVSGFQSTVSYIRSLPGQALSWGKDIIDAVIQGIKSKLEAMKSMMKEVAKTIKSFIGFSEPEEGPLSDFHTYMPDMIDLMTKGIKQGIPEIQSAMNALANTMVPSMKASENTMAAGQTNTTNSVNITVYGAQGQNVNELAAIIEQKITDNVVRRGVAFA